MNKNTVPEGITVPMALMDLLPVVLFGGVGILLGLLLKSPAAVICAAAALVSGALKVLWKLIAGLRKKNVWPLFVQMRIIMPVGLTGVIISSIISCGRIGWGRVLTALTGLPQLIFFILGIVGMAGMIFCAARLDSADPKANWIEQGINSIAQACFFAGLLVIYLK